MLQCSTLQHSTRSPPNGAALQTVHSVSFLWYYDTTVHTVLPPPPCCKSLVFFRLLILYIPPSYIALTRLFCNSVCGPQHIGHQHVVALSRRHLNMIFLFNMTIPHLMLFFPPHHVVNPVKTIYLYIYIYTVSYCIALFRGSAPSVLTSRLQY